MVSDQSQVGLQLAAPLLSHSTISVEIGPTFVSSIGAGVFGAGASMEGTGVGLGACTVYTQSLRAR